MTWVDVAARAADCLLAVPLGSTEQHGPHLPLSTDTDIAVALATRLAAARADVIVAPGLPYGASGEHAGFPGTVSIGSAALETVLVEVGRSADDFAAVLFISAHGGNAAAVRAAVGTLTSEGRRVRSWSPGPVAGGDAHAGLTETSVMMALEPGAVRTADIEPGCTTPLRELLPTLVGSGVRSVAGNGVLGDPVGSSSVTGQEILAGWEQSLLRAVEDWPLAGSRGEPEP